MGKAVHLIKDPPFTLCGVNLDEKTKAIGTEEESEVTCHNCLKLMDGEQMGAPPPQNSAPDKEELALWDGHIIMEALQRRLGGMMMDIPPLLLHVTSEDLLDNLITIREYLELAQNRASWVSAEFRRESSRMERERTQCEEEEGTDG